MDNYKLKVIAEDGTEKTTSIRVDDNGNILPLNEDGTLKPMARGANLGCLIGIHAKRNGVCVNCGAR